MSRAAVLALAAACSAPAPQRSAPVAPVPPPAAPAVPAAPPVVRTDAASGGSQAPPSGVIRLLAAAPEGDAALTADELHELRLWPALDGSQEPRIVDLPEPHALALGHRGDGFTAAVIDAAGGLYLATLDAQGRARSHVSLAADPAWNGIAMSSRGLVAWRADQSLSLLDGDGATLARLPTEAGERIVVVAVAGERAAVLLDRAGKRGVRAVALDRPGWGAWIDLASESADLIALAPSGRIAVRDTSRVTVLEPNGTQVSRYGADSGPLAFVDDVHVVTLNNDSLVWLGGKAPVDRHVLLAMVVAAGGRAIGAAASDVVIATPTETKYLGYEVESPTVAQAIGDGQLAIGFLSKLYTLDAQLRVASARSAETDRILALRWLGDDAWAMETGIEGIDFRLVTSGDVRFVSKTLDDVYVLAYEPTTRLLTRSLGSLPAVYRYEPAKHELVRVAQAADAGQYLQVELIPLARARAGVELLRVTMGSETTVDWLADASKLDKVAATARFSGSFAAADPTGNVYAWVAGTSGMELVVFRNGKRVRSLPAEGPMSVWPDPEGKRVAEITTKAVSVITADGARVWSVPVEHASTALWLSDGALAVVTTAGIVRIDPATGKLTAARCGWGFGLADSPHPATAVIEPVCAQLERGDE